MILLGPKWSVTNDVVTETIGILAVKRAGKSNAAVVMAEAMYDAGIPWVAIDLQPDRLDGRRHHEQAPQARACGRMEGIGRLHGGNQVRLHGGGICPRVTCQHSVADHEVDEDGVPICGEKDRPHTCRACAGHGPSLSFTGTPDGAQVRAACAGCDWLGPERERGDDLLGPIYEHLRQESYVEKVVSGEAF